MIEKIFISNLMYRENDKYSKTIIGEEIIEVTKNVPARTALAKAIPSESFPTNCNKKVKL